MGRYEKNYTYRTTPAGTLHVVDPSPLNWLYVLFNTMEEAVRADHEGRIIPSLAQDMKWIDDTTLQLHLRKGVVFHNNQFFTSKDVEESFNQALHWDAPHPPGTFINIPKETKLEVVDDYTVLLHFPKPEGLALGKLRGYHFANLLFWKMLGFGYVKLGTAEGHW
ncbi:ABC transporter substrate-binding protein [Bacillus sp. DJP31]|uniref:ABC transporter substrate-binding protein n=1 Tax=Bacillus sp. DJP31 TaxID=3409789 RepID=UPI003BB52F99